MSSKRILVVAGTPWFATRLGALSAPAGYGIVRVDNVSAARSELRRAAPTAVITYLAPRADGRGDDLVAALRESGFRGPIVVLDRIRKTEGNTYYLPRDASPGRIAAYVRGLVEAAA
jgi:hypothetical protein